MITRLMTLAGLAALIAGAASAQEYESTYTRIDDEACTWVEQEDQPVSDTTCPGFAGWEVLIVSGEHGQAEAYRSPAGETSDYITPPTRGLFGGYGEVIEWRLSGGVPFATIHRYVNDTPEMMDPDNAGQWHTLIVTALRPGTDIVACAAAYIDASSLPNANEIARQASDYLAINWQCGVEEPQMFDANSEYDVMTIAAQRRPGH